MTQELRTIVTADFHMHSCYSDDCNTSLDAISKAVVEAGLDCIALTDHDTIEGALLLKRHAPFQVIVGEEVSTNSGHVIGLFLEQCIPPGLSVEETVRCIKEQGGLAVAPHPFAWLAGDSLQQAFIDNAELFDAVEIANSNNFLPWDDKKAKNFAKSRAMLPITGSDSHCARGIGANKVSLPAFNDAPSLKESLKSASFQSRNHSPLYYFEYCSILLKRELKKRSNRALHE